MYACHVKQLQHFFKEITYTLLSFYPQHVRGTFSHSICMAIIILIHIIIQPEKLFGAPNLAQHLFMYAIHIHIPIAMEIHTIYIDIPASELLHLANTPAKHVTSKQIWSNTFMVPCFHHAIKPAAEATLHPSDLNTL